MNDNEIEQVIRQKCLATPAQQKLVNPATLRADIPAIGAQANELIAGLGLPKIESKSLAEA